MYFKDNCATSKLGSYCEIFNRHNTIRFYIIYFNHHTRKLFEFNSSIFLDELNDYNLKQMNFT